jgi:glycosyltransferase involved in cell wall biosynthesis
MSVGIRGAVESWLARMIVLSAYLLAETLCRLRPRRMERDRAPSGRIVVTGTFHNPGWFVSHLTPLAQSGLREVIVISHGNLPAVDGVRVCRPPRWLTALTGRTCSKFLWTLRAGIRFDADVFVGYHIIPNSLIALTVGRLLNRATCYQMTSGPIEIVGGGYRCSENPILRRLGRSSAWLERLAVGVGGRFDLVIVRGRTALQFVTERLRPARRGIIPGSVNLTRFTDPGLTRSYDLLFVGQLVSRKQPLRFIEIAAGVKKQLPQVRALMLGDGPLMPDVVRRIAELGLESTVEVAGQRAEVCPALVDSRIFVLPSRNEGLSIAMAEAMICGAVPVVANVGDLKDLVSNDETGYLVDHDTAEEYIARIVPLLEDPARWSRMSVNASRSAKAHNGLSQVSALWADHLRAIGAAVDSPHEAHGKGTARTELGLAPRASDLT